MGANIPKKDPQQAIVSFAMNELTKVVGDLKASRVPRDPSKLQEIYKTILQAQKELQEKKITEEELEKVIETEAKKVE